MNSLTAFDSDGFTLCKYELIINHGRCVNLRIMELESSANGQGSANTDGSINTTYTVC